MAGDKERHAEGESEGDEGVPHKQRCALGVGKSPEFRGEREVRLGEGN